VNAILPIQPPSGCARFDAARNAAAALRGACLDLFARGEAAVTQTLLTMAAVEGRGASIKLPHLVGQRLDALASAIDAGGVFAGDGPAAASALARFRKHDSLRSDLTHSTFTVTLDQRGHWHLAARLLALRSRREARDVMVTTQEEASQILSGIERDFSRLRSTLGQLRQRLRRAGRESTDRLTR
jgi:hypothetical protein